MLYKFKKEEALFNDLKFLVVAAYNREDKPNICNRILAESEGEGLLLVATDSQSLHSVQLNKLESIALEAGDYEIIKADAREIILWQREFEEPFADYRTMSLWKGKTKVLPEIRISRKYDWPAIYKICQAGFCLDFERLTPLADDVCWKVYSNKERQILLFERMNLCAFIMCRRADEEEA